MLAGSTGRCCRPPLGWREEEAAAGAAAAGDGCCTRGDQIGMVRLEKTWPPRGGMEDEAAGARGMRYAGEWRGGS